MFSCKQNLFFIKNYYSESEDYFYDLKKDKELAEIDDERTHFKKKLKNYQVSWSELSNWLYFYSEGQFYEMRLGSGNLIPLLMTEETDVHSNSGDVFKTEETAVNSNSDDVFKTEDIAVHSNSDDVFKTEEIAVHQSSQSFVEETESGETRSMVVAELLKESENKRKIICFMRAYKSFKCKCLTFYRQIQNLSCFK